MGHAELQYVVLPDVDNPALLARVRWPDVCQAMSHGRPVWQDDLGLFDLPYAPNSAVVTVQQAVAIAAAWGVRLDPNEPPKPGAALMRRMPPDWTDLSPAERRAWALDANGSDASSTARRDAAAVPPSTTDHVESNGSGHAPGAESNGSGHAPGAESNGSGHAQGAESNGSGHAPGTADVQAPRRRWFRRRAAPAPLPGAAPPAPLAQAAPPAPLAQAAPPAPLAQAAPPAPLALPPPPVPLALPPPAGLDALRRATTGTDGATEVPDSIDITLDAAPSDGWEQTVAGELIDVADVHPVSVVDGAGPP
jgi:hypothetical protein